MLICSAFKTIDIIKPITAQICSYQDYDHSFRQSQCSLDGCPGQQKDNRELVNLAAALGCELNQNGGVLICNPRIKWTSRSQNS